MASQTVIRGAAKVAQTKGFVDYGEAFMKGYGKTLEKKKQREEEAKATQARVNALMGGFKNDIDVIKFKPEDQSLVKNTIVGWRNEYAAAANAAAKIQDKSSAEYQEYMDVMNNIQNRMVNLKNNLDNFAAFKADYAENIKAGTYSNAGANALSLAQGETMVTSPIGNISDSGDLQWGPGTGSVRDGFSFQEYEAPFYKATNTATALGAIADPYRRQKTPLDALQKNRIREQVTNLVSDPKALASLISDSDLPEFDFSNIDPEDPNAKQQTIDLLVNSIYRLQGSGLTAAERTATRGKGATTAKKDRTPEYVEKLDALFATPGVPKVIGGVKVYYDPDVDMVDPEGPRVQKGGYVYKGGGQTVVLSYDEMIDFLNS